MAAKTLQSLAGAQFLPLLAPDLTSWSDRVNGQAYASVTAINASAGLTTMLSLTGKFLIDILFLDSMTSNDVEGVKLTIDGVVIWSETGLSSNGVTEPILGQSDADHGHQIRCDASLLLEIDTTADTSIDLIYQVRPIL